MNFIDQLPEGWWTTGPACTTLSDYFRRHVVGLAVEYRLGDGRSDVAHYTGVLYRDARGTKWLSAGHVIEEIARLAASSEYSVRRARLVDHGVITNAPALPVELSSLQRFISPDPEVDFGYLELTQLVADGVINGGGVQPLDPEAWRNAEAHVPEGYYVVGYPKEAIRVHTRPIATGFREYSLTSTLVCLPVRELAEAERLHGQGFWSSPGSFYGVLLPIASPVLNLPESVSGMSGGPLFSFRRDAGSVRYHLRGFQRSWMSAQNIIRCDRIPDIIPMLGE